MEQYEEVNDFSIENYNGLIWLESEKYKGPIFLAPLDCHKLFEIEGDDIEVKGFERYYFKKTILLLSNSSYGLFKIIGEENCQVRPIICKVKDL